MDQQAVAAAADRAPRQVPIFIFPQQLDFYADDASTNVRILTIHNPYDFPLKFKLLSTAPRNYKIAASHGKVRPKCCADICIRRVDFAAHATVLDKFKIHVLHGHTEEMLGSKIVKSRLFNTAVPDGLDDHGNSSMSDLGTSVSSQDDSTNDDLSWRVVRQRALARRYCKVSNRSNLKLMILIGLISLIGLLLPCESEDDGYEYFLEVLRLTRNVKLFCAFFLGLATIIVAKSR